jgi:hypothetical protein
VNPYPQASDEVIRPRKAKDEIAQPVEVKLWPQYPVLDICMWRKRMLTTGLDLICPQILQAIRGT